jgi:hypothetical protein
MRRRAMTRLATPTCAHDTPPGVLRPYLKTTSIRAGAQIRVRVSSHHVWERKSLCDLVMTRWCLHDPGGHFAGSGWAAA